MMKILHKFKNIASYGIVGGAAALVEWAAFYVCDAIGLFYLLSTILSFIVATFVNWILGRKITFRNSPKLANWPRDLLSVYVASGVGLLLNLGLMVLFVSVIGIDSMISKIISTGLVFFWNYFIRKLVIYQ